MTGQAQDIEQVPAPVAPLPETSSLSESQWQVIAAIANTVIPSISPSDETNGRDGHYLQPTAYAAASAAIVKHNAIDQSVAVDYLAESPTANPYFREAINRLVFQSTDAEARKRLFVVLSILNGRASVLLTGYSTPFPQLPISARDEIVRGWSTARLPVFHSLHRSLTMMVNNAWVRTSPSIDRILAIPKTPVNHKFGPGYDFSFLQIPPATEAEAEIIETDILVIGSGCAGAVAASTLSACGLSVIVADKGYYWSPKYLPMTVESGTTHLFHNSGFTVSDGGHMTIASASCFGGGGTVNWSASLQLQAFVRQEWAKHGLPYFTSSAFQADMDAVCERMGVGIAAVKHNYGNQRLLSGARKLGMTGKIVPQNTGGEGHECGFCTLGCGSCGKKGPTETWLPDAAQHGAQFIEGFQCERILFSDRKTASGEKIAIGAEGIWTSRDEHGGVSDTRYRRLVKIMARRAVIVASGSLGSPHLLLRSGIMNRHLGAHLKLHPTSFLAAVYDEEVRPWEGSILTSVVSDLENIGSSGYGAKLEATTMIPSMFLALFPWKTGLEYKLFCAKFRRMTGYISLARDYGEGRVYVDPTEKARLRVDYNTHLTDGKHIAMGLVALAKIQYIEGAREIHVSVPGVPAFVREGETFEDGINDPAFTSWLTNLERLTTAGLPSNTSFACAHQMGSARMGSSPRTSVVDPHGRVWGTQGLHVVDASVFPAASGVNPMITTMGTARGIARSIARSNGKAPIAEEARAKL